MTNNDKKIKIMHLVSYFGYDGPSRGVLGQVKYTDSNKFHNTICELKRSRHCELIEKIHAMDCDHLSLNKRPYDITTILKLVRVLKKKKINLLNTHNMMPCWYGNIAAKLAGIPVVFTLRNLQIENYKFLFKKKMFYKPAIAIDSLTMSFADRVVAVSEKLRDYYINNTRIPKNKFMAIQNAIDLEPVKRSADWKKIKHDLGISETSVVIGIVGDLVPRKGHDLLVEAARIISQKNKNFTFLFVGDGPEKDNLRKLINKYDLSSHFVFMGHVKDVYSLLSIMDIFALPSYAEGISRALMESMAMSIPSVCSDIDGNVEAVLNDKTGFIFPSGDYQALARNLLLLISNHDLRKQMGVNASLRIYNNFNMSDLSHKYEALYLELLGGSNRET